MSEKLLTGMLNINTQEVVAPYRYDRKIVDWDVKRQFKQTSKTTIKIEHVHEKTNIMGSYQV